MSMLTPQERGRVGMYCLIGAEAAMFTIFVVAYLFYLGKSVSGPTPKDVLHAPVLFTICLLSSSLTAHVAVRALGRGKTNTFESWWLLTITLGAIFLLGTAREWRHLIFDEGLTISTNLFGTTYCSLVGLHAFHVTLGLPLATARITSTPPPGPMMAYVPCGRSTFTTAGAAATRSRRQL